MSEDEQRDGRMQGNIERRRRVGDGQHEVISASERLDHLAASGGLLCDDQNDLLHGSPLRRPSISSRRGPLLALDQDQEIAQPGHQLERHLFERAGAFVKRR